LKYKVLYFGGRKKEFETLEDYEDFVRTYYPYAWRYIEEGETKGVSEKPTCKGRKPWWDLGDWEPAEILYFMTLRDRFFTVKNAGALEDARLYGISCRGNCSKPFLFLNSILDFLNRELLTRSYGGGGGPIDIKVYEVQNFPLPAQLNLSPSEESRLLNLLREAKISSIFEEIGTDDPQKVDLSKVKPHRLELDLAILRALGFENPKELLKELYAELIDLVRSRLERAKSVQKTKKKRTKKEIDEYLKRLKELIKDLTPERSYLFAKQLEEIIKNRISPDEKIARKILNAYWRKTFGEKLNLRELRKKMGIQKRLF